MANNPVLYILMRTDLDSLNPGKAMAQAAHAANQFVAYAREMKNVDGIFHEAFNEWERQANFFGTTIVLDGKDEETIVRLVNKCADRSYLSAVVVDPEYPLRDGKVTHILPNFITCGYVFSPNGKIEELSELSLHP